MKIWVDDIRPAPDDYAWCKSVDRAKWMIEFCELNAKSTNPLIAESCTIELIDIDHDAGFFCRSWRRLHQASRLARRNRTQLPHQNPQYESCGC